LLIPIYGSNIELERNRSRPLMMADTQDQWIQAALLCAPRVERNNDVRVHHFKGTPKFAQDLHRNFGFMWFDMVFFKTAKNTKH
jgi:hypothetical protein